MCECVPECGSKCVSGLVGVLICVWLCIVCVYQAIVYLVVRPATDILESEHSVWVKMKMRVSACVCVCVCVCWCECRCVCMFVFSICMFYYSKWVCTKPIYTKMLQSKRPIPSGVQKWLIHGITDSRVFAVKRALLLFLVFCPLPLPKIKKFVGPVKAGRLLHTDIHTHRGYLIGPFPFGRGGSN